MCLDAGRPRYGSSALRQVDGDLQRQAPSPVSFYFWLMSCAVSPMVRLRAEGCLGVRRRRCERSGQASDRLRVSRTTKQFLPYLLRR
jgi:hypothetical protein